MQALGGAAAGALSGAFANDSERGKMTTAGNAYSLTPEQIEQQKGIQRQTQGLIGSYGGDPTQELQNNAVLGGMFGQGGSLSNALGEEKDLANRGYGLQNEDHEAYGQASGDIARMFGQNDQSLAQALSDRGLSNSGVAGQAFSGSLGNKNEQLAGLQTQIAQKRMQMNHERLNSTRNFISQMGNQAQSGINEMQQLGRQKAGDYNQANSTRFDMANSILGNHQNQMNNQLNQEQQTKHSSDIGNMVNGGIGGAMAGAKMMSGAAPGGASAGPSMAGSSYLKGGMFA